MKYRSVEITINSILDGMIWTKMGRKQKQIAIVINYIQNEN